jgi:hypothetical protein
MAVAGKVRATATVEMIDLNVNMTYRIVHGPCQFPDGNMEYGNGNEVKWNGSRNGSQV